MEAEEGAVKIREWRELLGRYIVGTMETEYPSLTDGARSLPPYRERSRYEGDRGA